MLATNGACDAAVLKDRHELAFIVRDAFIVREFRAARSGKIFKYLRYQFQMSEGRFALTIANFIRPGTVKIQAQSLALNCALAGPS